MHLKSKSLNSFLIGFKGNFTNNMNNSTKLLNNIKIREEFKNHKNNLKIIIKLRFSKINGIQYE